MTPTPSISWAALWAQARQKTSSSRPIIAIGDLVADFIVAGVSLPARAGQHQEVQDVHLEPGGGANFLIAGARLGYPMKVIGLLGDDPWGYQVATMIRSEGVDLSGVRHTGTSTRVIVLVGQAGEHLFLGKHGVGEEIILTPPDRKQIGEAGAIYCAGYTLNEKGLVGAALETMELAQEAQVPLFFDPGPQIVYVPDDLRRKIIPLIDTLLITEEELSLFTDHSVAELMKLGPKTVIVKQGAAGCTVYSHEQPPFQGTGYPVSVVDTSAAGDSFNAAFMIARLWGWPLLACARLANAMGAAKVKKLGGGRNVPTLAEIQEALAQFEPDFER